MCMSLYHMYTIGGAYVIAEIVAEIERTVIKASTLCKGKMVRPHKGFHTHAGFNTSAIHELQKEGENGYVA